MRRVSDQRLAARAEARRLRPAGAAGLLAAALFLCSFALLGAPPEPSEAPGQLLPYLEGHRTGILAAALVLGAGSSLFLWYLTGLRRLLGSSEADGLGLACALGAVVATTLVVAGMSVLAAVAVRPSDIRVNVVVFDVFNALVTMGGYGYSLSLACAAAASSRTRSLSGGWRVSAAAIAVVQLATIPGLFVQAGPLAPLGPLALLAFWLLTFWYAAAAVRMVRGPR